MAAECNTAAVCSDGDSISGTNDSNDPIYNLVTSSLNKSDQKHRDMFLDAATVFYGRKAQAARYGWKQIYDYTGLQQLQQRSLVKVIHDAIWIHDVVKSIARKLADIGNRSNMIRVWRVELC
jgi:hypothetical protein